MAPLVATAMPAAAVPTLYRIQIDNVGGVFSFVDPPGFVCSNGAFPQHNPPNAIERRCVPTFGTVSCGDLSVAATIDGLPGSNVQANGMCHDGTFAPPFAGCVATVPPFALAGSCANTPPPQTTFVPFEFVCHAPAAGIWLRYHVDCYAIVA